jgi:uncharacterized Tic20 family protein
MKSAFVTIFGLALIVGGCIPFGTAVTNAFNVNEVYSEEITLNKNHISSKISVNTEQHILPAISIHLTTDEIRKNLQSDHDEYDAKYRFPINMVINDLSGKQLYQYRGKLEWDSGTKSNISEDINSRQGDVYVEIDIAKIKIQPPGEFTVSVFIGEDEFYYAQLHSAKLIIYDNVYTHSKAVITGVSIIGIGIIIFIAGLVMLVIQQTKSTNMKPSENLKTENSDDHTENAESLITNKNELSQSSVTTSAMLCHLSTFAGFLIPFGGVLGPLIMWLIKRDEHPFINRHGIAALNFHLSMAIYYFVSFLLAFVIIGFFFLMILALLDLIFTIIACIKASNGDEYSYPLALPFIKVNTKSN